jgi:hypothetical protein
MNLECFKDDGTLYARGDHEQLFRNQIPIAREEFSGLGSHGFLQLSLSIEHDGKLFLRLWNSETQTLVARPLCELPEEAAASILDAAKELFSEQLPNRVV